MNRSGNCVESVVRSEICEYAMAWSQGFICSVGSAYGTDFTQPVCVCGAWRKRA